MPPPERPKIRPFAVRRDSPKVRLTEVLFDQLVKLVVAERAAA